MMIVLDFKEMEMPKARPSDEYLILRGGDFTCPETLLQPPATWN